MSALDLSVAGQLASSLSRADFSRILESFAEDVVRLADEMEAALHAAEPMGVKRAAHGLAGAAAAVGAMALEAAARRGLSLGPYPDDLIARVRAESTDAVRELQALCDKGAAPGR